MGMVKYMYKMNKKLGESGGGFMKRFVLIISVCILCSLLLCGCPSPTIANDDLSGEFFGEDYLEARNLSGMPVPKLENSVLRNGGVIYLNLTDDEYVEYLGQIIEYLRARDDVFNLSRFVHTDYLWIFPIKSVYAPIGDSYVPHCDSIELLFSHTEELDESDGFIDPIYVHLKRQSGTLSYSGFTYNCSLSIGMSTICYLDRCYEEHTYDEGIELIVPSTVDEPMTLKYHTCIWCGSTHYSSFIGDMKYYNITISEGEEYLVNKSVLGANISGLIVDIRTGMIHSDLVLEANGIQIPGHASDEDMLWHYTFVMPCESVKISFKQPEAASTRKLFSELEPWISDIDPSNVDQLKVTKSYVGVAPGSLAAVRRVSDPDSILSVISAFRSIGMNPTSPSASNLDGGNNVAFEFILSDGEVKVVTFRGGCYLDGYDDPTASSYTCYKPDALPGIGEDFELSYSFVASNLNTAHPTLYDAQVGNYVPVSGYEIDLGTLEFVECDGGELASAQCACRLESDLIVLEVYSNDVFRLDGTFYRLVNTTFRDAIEEIGG